MLAALTRHVTDRHYHATTARQCTITPISADDIIPSSGRIPPMSSALREREQAAAGQPASQPDW
jgi:hypothetical protein